MASLKIAKMACAWRSKRQWTRVCLFIMVCLPPRLGRKCNDIACGLVAGVAKRDIRAKLQGKAIAGVEMPCLRLQGDFQRAFEHPYLLMNEPMTDRTFKSHAFTRWEYHLDQFYWR